MRAAAVQFATTTDVDANLATVLRMLNQAAEVQPDIVVTPEFSNRLSWYNDKESAYEHAVETDGPFLAAVAENARRNRMHVVVNVTVRRSYPRITITSFLYSPEGKLVLAADKQTLMGRENLFFDRADSLSDVAALPIGKLGLFMCRDGVTMETPRGLALRGAQVLCNSLNSFAFDEADLHIPVRAPENRVFVVSANKVGPLIPIEILPGAAEKLGVPADLLYGSGESQVVAPDGTVLAKAPRRGEAVIYADFDPGEADHKIRPDGTHVFNNRRPALYTDITTPPHDPDEHPAAEAATAAVHHFASAQPSLVEVAAAVRGAAAAGAALLVFPELTGVDPENLAVSSAALLEAVQDAIGDCEIAVCTSVAEPGSEGGLVHTGVLVTREGVVLSQPQLHQTEAHPWSTPGDAIRTVDLPWGRLGIMVGDDSIYPETARVLAIRGVDVIAVPFEAREAWELSLGLVDRSTENRVCLVAATRLKPFGGSLVITQWKDFQIFTSWTQRKFTGTINEPIVHRAPPEAGLFAAEIHPETARFKTMSYETDLIRGRPWALSGPLTENA